MTGIQQYAIACFYQLYSTATSGGKKKSVPYLAQPRLQVWLDGYTRNISFVLLATILAHLLRAPTRTHFFPPRSLSSQISKMSGKHRCTHQISIFWAQSTMQQKSTFATGWGVSVLTQTSVSGCQYRLLQKHVCISSGINAKTDSCSDTPLLHVGANIIYSRAVIQFSTCLL